MNPHNICEWARRLSGRTQRLSCGEVGTPPEASQLPPAPANLAAPENEPGGMRFIRRAYQVPDGKFPVGKFTDLDWQKHRWGYYRMIEKDIESIDMGPWMFISVVLLKVPLRSGDQHVVDPGRCAIASDALDSHPQPDVIICV
ncbi:MAG: hypothetical protein GY809_24640, partial [Planctomycetes bacterium]|nr:hypothetical protein [Planctomycetota bacterium]